MTNPPDQSSAILPPVPRRVAWAEVGLIVAVFFLFAGSPVPDVNEPHYLSKAKHYWDPAWCEGDFFLESHDVHEVFYWTCGWITRWLSLDAAAWVGRFLAWTLLAWAWRRLSMACVPRPWYAVLSAALFVLLIGRLHMAGEWVVGGVEAKGFAYVLVLLAMESLVRGRWNRMWLLLGAASSFHVLVGGWTVIAAGLAWLVCRRDRPPLVSMIPALLGGLLLSLPGLWPALALTLSADSQTVGEANVIYVFRRLRHHLVVTSFQPVFILRHVALVVVFLALGWATHAGAAIGRLRAIVLGAIVIALIGAAVNLALQHDQEAAAAVLRYYWFRMSDALVPMGTALLVIVHIAWLRQARPAWGNALLLAAMLAAGINLGEISLTRRGNPVPLADPPRKVADFDDWRDVCRWVADEQNTDPRAGFLVPRLSQTFRWRTGRRVAATWKDIPQDAGGVVQWWDRIDAIYRYDDQQGRRRWYNSLAEIPPERLVSLCEQYDAQYVVTAVKPNTEPAAKIPPVVVHLSAGDEAKRYQLVRVYRNATYEVYQRRVVSFAIESPATTDAPADGNARPP